jgi:hypothetical protein
MPLTRLHVAIILAIIFFLGCGGKVQPKPVPVRGKLVGIETKSVGKVTVIFWPEDTKTNRGGGAVCEADGSFFLECLPGSYKVTISSIRPLGATAPPVPQTPESAIPVRYQNELTTTLTVHVPEKGKEDIVLSLK